MHSRLLFILLLTLLLPVKLFAEDSQPAPWPVVERCLPAPRPPAKNWSFDGEILMNGWAGIHGVRATRTTPYVVHWGDGLLSPDGQWVLNQKVDEETEQLSGPGPMGRYHFYYGDIIVSSTTSRERLIFPWDAYFSMTSRPYLFGPAGPLWLDNHRFAAIYAGVNETRIVDIETGTIVEWPDVYLDDYEISFSPDLTRMVYNSKLYELPGRKQIQETPVGTDYDFTSGVWAHDSSMFIDFLPGTGDRTKNLTLFNRDGESIATPLTNETRTILLGSWSPTNQYFEFTFWGRDDADTRGHVFILDIPNKQVINLCIDSTIGGWAWSPDGSKFATVLGNGQAPVIVTDMQEWQPYIVAYQDGSVLFWRTLK
jgi:hypothetical protein